MTTRTGRLNILGGVLAIMLVAGGCTGDDDDVADDDILDDDTGDDDTGDDDSADDDDTGDDDSADDDSWDCYANPMVSAIGADGSGLMQGVIDGTEYWFVLDTAAQVVFGDLEVSGGSTAYFDAAMTIGPWDYDPWSIKGRDLSPNEAFIGTDIGALFGQILLLLSYVVFDPSTPQLYLCDSIPDEYPPGTSGDPLIQSFTLENQFPVTRVGVGLPVDVPMMLDTGIPVTYLTQDIFDQVDVGASRIYGWTFASSYGSDEAFVSRVPTFEFAGETIEGQEVVVIPTDHHLDVILAGAGVEVKGFLGNSVMDRYLLGLNGFDSEMQLWPVDAEWLDPHRWDRVGVEITWREGQYVVEFVLGPSDAETQGILVGDRLTAVDGVDCATLDLHQVHLALRGTPGDTRQLTLEGDEGQYQLEVLVEELLPEL